MPSFRSVALGLRHRRNVDASQSFTQIVDMYSKRQINSIRKNKYSIITGLPKKMTSVLKKNIATLMADKERERVAKLEAEELKQRERIYDTRCVFFDDDLDATVEPSDNDDDVFPLLPGECVQLPIASQQENVCTSSTNILERAVSIADIFGDSNDDAIEAFQNGAAHEDSLDCVIVDEDVTRVPSGQDVIPRFSLCLSPDTDDEEEKEREKSERAVVDKLRAMTSVVDVVEDTMDVPLSPLKRVLQEKKREEIREEAQKITRSFPRLPTGGEKRKTNLDDWLSVKRKTSVDSRVSNKHETVIVRDNDDECVIKTVITQTIITTYRKK